MAAQTYTLAAFFFADRHQCARACSLEVCLLGNSMESFVRKQHLNPISSECTFILTDDWIPRSALEYDRDRQQQDFGTQHGQVDDQLIQAQIRTQ